MASEKKVWEIIRDAGFDPLEDRGITSKASPAARSISQVQPSGNSPETDRVQALLSYCIARIWASAWRCQFEKVIKSIPPGQVMSGSRRPKDE